MHEKCKHPCKNRNSMFPMFSSFMASFCLLCLPVISYWFLKAFHERVTPALLCEVLKLHPFFPPRSPFLAISSLTQRMTFSHRKLAQCLLEIRYRCIRAPSSLHLQTMMGISHEQAYFQHTQLCSKPQHYLYIQLLYG